MAVSSLWMERSSRSMNRDMSLTLASSFLSFSASLLRCNQRGNTSTGCCDARGHAVKLHSEFVPLPRLVSSVAMKRAPYGYSVCFFTVSGEKCFWQKQFSIQQHRQSLLLLSCPAAPTTSFVVWSPESRLRVS
jgi:hypothetical protein